MTPNTAVDITIRRADITLAGARGGSGRPLLVCPGLLTTQADLLPLASALRRDFEVTTVDLRGHGRSGAAADYRFEAFRDDLSAIVDTFATPPLLVGHSFGADLAVHVAATGPEAVAGLVLVDGANPLPEPFLTEADLDEFRAMAGAMQDAYESVRGTDRQVLLTAEDVIGLNLEIDSVRSRLLDRFDELSVPVHVIASTAMAGRGDDDRTGWRNNNWHAGFERLRRLRPQITIDWLDAGHDLVRTHAEEIAQLITDRRLDASA